MSQSERRALLSSLALGLLTRLPFYLRASREALDGDASIVGLMGRHPGLHLAFWGQPYGSAVDGWLAAPFVAALGMTPDAVRLAYLVASLALIPLAYLMGRALDRSAALPAALLLACPSTFFLDLAAFPLPFYPTVLVLHALLFLGALEIVKNEGDGGRVFWRALIWGTLAGIALWTHLVSVGVILACAIYVAPRSRAGGRWPRLALFMAIPAMALASAPLWYVLLSTPSARAVASVWRPHETTAHLVQLLSRIHEPVFIVLGARGLLPSDEVSVGSQWLASSLLIIIYVLLLGLAIRSDWRRAAVRMLVLAIAFVGAAFLFALRSTPDTARYLSPTYLPLAALAALGITRARPARLGRSLLIGILLLNAAHGARLWLEWRRHQAIEPLMPDCRPVLELLHERGIRRAWASYHMAYCITFTSGEKIIASQPWNERFPGYPLPYADEVKFARNVAWIFHPSRDFALPPPDRFKARLAASGARWRRTELGDVVVFDEFVPPFSPEVVSFASRGAAADQDPDTYIVEPGHCATVYRFERPTALAGVTLLGSPHGPALPSGMSVEVSSDGERFVRAARLRAGLRRDEIVWLNGQPQLRTEEAASSFPLSGMKVSALRIRPAPPQTQWAIAELLLHPRSTDAPWDDWLAEDLSWKERRRALAERQRRDRADWYYRSLLVERQSWR
jgi:hypothetical protein